MDLGLNPPDPRPTLRGELAPDEATGPQLVEEDDGRVWAPHEPLLRLRLDFTGRERPSRIPEKPHDEPFGLLTVQLSRFHDPRVRARPFISIDHAAENEHSTFYCLRP